MEDEDRRAGEDRERGDKGRGRPPVVPPPKPEPIKPPRPSAS